MEYDVASQFPFRSNLQLSWISDLIQYVFEKTFHSPQLCRSFCWCSTQSSSFSAISKQLAVSICNKNFETKYKWSFFVASQALSLKVFQEQYAYLLVTKVPPFAQTGSQHEFLWELVQCPKKREIFLLWLPQLNRPNWAKKVREMDKETEYI